MEKENQVGVYKKENLNRALKSRHLQMIAIGSAIGTGLFYGSAWSIKTAGPAIILMYLISAFAVYFIMRDLGEMTVAEPVSGAFVSYANRYIHRFVGFLTGWNGFIFLLATAAAELNALGHYIQFWLPGVPIWISAFVALGMLFLVNIISVRFYGETEFWFSMIKVAAIVAMILFGLCMIFIGLGNDGVPLGLGNLYEHGGFIPNGMTGVLLSVVMVAFSYGGTENLGMAAGEAEDVEKTMRHAINATFWRLLIFYVGAMFVLVTIFPWDAISGKSSPFVEIFSHMGIPAAASIMNVVVVAAVLSTLNGLIFFCSRSFYNMSVEGNAPAFLSKVNAGNVPAVAVKVVFCTMFASVILNYFMPEQVFQLFSSVTVFAVLCNWSCIIFSHLKFRKLHELKGDAQDISFRSPWYPYSDYVAIVFMLIVVACMAIMPETRMSLVICAIWVAVVYGVYRKIIK